MISNYSKLRCGDCSETIGYYHSGSSAPHYHAYLCHWCAKKASQEEDEEDEEEHSDGE